MEKQTRGGEGHVQGLEPGMGMGQLLTVRLQFPTHLRVTATS